MTRRFDAGPLLLTLGGLLLLASLFLDWYADGIDAWLAFEAWDVVLMVLALGAIAIGIGLLVPGGELLDRRWIPAGVAAVAIIVASQIVDPPPAVTGRDADTGAWLALCSAVVMCAGALLTFSRVRLAFTVEGRERQHVWAVDHRGEPESVTDSHAAVRAPRRDPPFVPDPGPAGPGAVPAGEAMPPAGNRPPTENEV